MQFKLAGQDPYGLDDSNAEFVDLEFVGVDTIDPVFEFILSDPTFGFITCAGFHVFRAGTPLEPFTVPADIRTRLVSRQRRLYSRNFTVENLLPARQNAGDSRELYEYFTTRSSRLESLPEDTPTDESIFQLYGVSNFDGPVFRLMKNRRYKVTLFGVETTGAVNITLSLNGFLPDKTRESTIVTGKQVAIREYFFTYIDEWTVRPLIQLQATGAKFYADRIDIVELIP
jgi:hypothetical protein